LTRTFVCLRFLCIDGVQVACFNCVSVTGTLEALRLHTNITVLYLYHNTLIGTCSSVRHDDDGFLYRVRIVYHSSQIASFVQTMHHIIRVSFNLYVGFSLHV
jgi:hypothetical protein